MDRNARPLPPRLAAEATRRYQRLRTSDDGGCSVHAAFGTESPRGLRHPRARAFLAETFSGAADVFSVRMGNAALVLEFSSTLWDDVIKPQAKVAAGRDGGERAAGEEARWIRQRLERNAPDVWAACVGAVIK